MNKKQIGGIAILVTTLVAGAAVFSIANSQKPETQIVRPAAEDLAPAAPVQRVTNDPASQPNPVRIAPGPGPLVQSETVFRPFKCVNQRTNATVFELGRARNAQYMGQRNNRAFWKVDTPSRTVTFNTDVRDINCAFTR